MKRRTRRIFRIAVAVLFCLAQITGLIPDTATAETTYHKHIVMKGGNCIAIWNTDISASEVTSYKITVQVTSGTRYDIIVPDGSGILRMGYNGSSGFQTGQLSTYLKESAGSNRGVLAWIKVRSGKVKLTVDTVSNNALSQENIRPYEMSKPPMKLVKVSKKKSINFQMSSQNNLTRMPLIMCGTTGSRVKRVLDSATKTYEVYKFTGSGLNKVLYMNGKKASSINLRYVTTFTDSDKSYYCAMNPFIPSEVTHQSGWLYTISGDAGYIGFGMETEENAVGIYTKWTTSSEDDSPWEDINKENSILITEAWSEGIYSENDEGNETWDDDFYTVQYWDEETREKVSFTVQRRGDIRKTVGEFSATLIEKGSYDISFMSGGGSGSMAGDTGAGSYTLPACGFTAPGGKCFREWAVKIGNQAPVSKQPREDIVVTGDTVIEAVWQDKPAFTSCGLQLAGTIGMMFYVSIPEDYYGVTDEVRFTVNNVQTRTVWAEDYQLNGDRRYYLCPVNIYQMNDPVTAEYYHMGEIVSRVQTTVYDYLLALLQQPVEGKLKNLLTAIMDYGAYSQRYLAELNEWTVGVDHAEAKPYHQSLPAEGNPAAAYGRTWVTRDDDLIEYAQYFLTLDADTTLHVQVKFRDGIAGKVYGYASKTNCYAFDVGDNTWEVSLNGIPANGLMKAYDFLFFLVSDDGVEKTAAEIVLSPLYYVNLVMRQSTDTKERQAMQALYNYAMATMDYVQ